MASGHDMCKECWEAIPCNCSAQIDRYRKEGMNEGFQLVSSRLLMKAVECRKNGRINKSKFLSRLAKEIHKYKI